MRLSTSTCICFNRPGGRTAPISETMERCAAAGFHRMDLSFYDYTRYRHPFVGPDWEQWLGDIQSLAEKLDMSFGQAHAPFYNFCDPCAPDAAELDNLILRSIDCCSALGIPWLVIHAGTDYESPTPAASSKKKNRDYFAPILEFANRRNVGIAFENLWERNIAPKRNYTTTAEELLELCAAFDTPMAGICWDTDHAALSGQNQPEHLRLIGSKLVATHISDCYGIGSDHLLPFCGSILWEPIVRALADIGYTGDFTYEVFRYTSTVPDALLPAALAHSVIVGEYLLTLKEGFACKLT